MNTRPFSRTGRWKNGLFLARIFFFFFFFFFWRSGNFREKVHAVHKCDMAKTSKCWIFIVLSLSLCNIAFKFSLVGSRELFSFFFKISMIQLAKSQCLKQKIREPITDAKPLVGDHFKNDLIFVKTTLAFFWIRFDWYNC